MSNQTKALRQLLDAHNNSAALGHNKTLEKINEPHHLTGTLKPVTIHT
jgi:hypothetical protein